MDPHTNVDVLQLRVEEEEVYLQQSQDHEVELCQTLRLQVEDLQKRLEEKDNKLTQANKVIRALRDEVQTLQQQLEQHRRKYSDDAIERSESGRGNGITTLTGSVPSDCCPSEPAPGSSDAGTSHKDQDITSQDVTSQNCPPFALLETNFALKTGICEMPPNIFLSCTSEEDPANVSMPPDHNTLTSPLELEDDPADDVPLSPDDGTLTSPQELKLEDDPADVLLSPGDGTLSTVKSQLELKLPVLSVKLQDCRELLGPDGVFKIQSEEDDDDDGDDLCYQDNDDDSDYDPKRSVPSDCCPSEPAPGSSDAGTSHKDQDITSQDVTSQNCPPFALLETNFALKTGICEMPPNIFLSCTSEEDPANVSMPPDHNTLTSPLELEDDPADDVPLSPDDGTLTSPQELKLEDDPADVLLSPGDGTLSTVKSQLELKLPVLSVKLQDCRELLGPDGVFKIQSEEDDDDDGDDLCYQDNDDDSDYDPKSDGFYLYSENKEVLSPPEGGIAEPEGEQRRQSRGGKRLSTDSPHENTSIASPNNGNDQTVDKISLQSGGLLQHQTLQKLPPGNPRRSIKGAEKRKGYECFVCGKTLASRRSLGDHLGLHSGERPYACTQCDKTFKHRSEFYYHKISHTGEKPYTCTQCEKTFRSYHGLYDHRKRHHTQERPSMVSPNTKTKKGKSYACHVCGKILAHGGSLREHLKLHSGERPYSCTQCDKTFRHKLSLRRHIRCHKGEKPFACAQCGKTFRCSGNLGAHQKRLHTQERSTESSNTVSDQGVDQTSTQSSTNNQHPTDSLQDNTSTDHLRVHSVERPYGCTQCDKSFRLKKALRIHERTHTGERPYACTQCDKTFKDKCTLRAHKTVHTGEKPYVCTQCGKAFRTLGNLRGHEIIHPTSGGEREKFPCDVCGKVLASRENLRLHKRLHTGTGIQCDVCGILISKPSNLIKHQRIHTGERPYACTLCEKTCTTKHDLIQHHRVHTNERPYKCSECPLAFKMSGQLKRHARRKHTGAKSY